MIQCRSVKYKNILNKVKHIIVEMG